MRSLRSPPLVIAAALAALAIAGFVVTLDRSPVAWPDSIIYASIARSLQLDHIGVPTVLRDSPAAIDHLPFYGPVFFRIVAWLFALVGFSDASIRLVSLGGALLIAIGGAGLVRALGGSRERQAWVGALLLLSPELGRGATDGRMDTLAVGFEVLALAVFAFALRPRSGAWLHGTAAGVLIAAAALTTPRSYPFVAAFFAGSLTLAWIARHRGTVLRPIAACGFTVLILVGAWTVAAHGGPIRWFGYMSFIGTHENVDIALLAPRRDWSFTPWAAITPIAIAVALILSSSSARHDAGDANGVRAVALFGRLVAGLNLIVCLLLFNFTFFFGIYLFVPLLAVALASAPGTRTAAKLLAALLAADIAVRTGRYVRLATVWPGTDPEKMARFIEAHVPPGSDVVGEESFYFFAVEGAGSHYLFTTRSSADWTLWVPDSDPSRAAGGPRRGDPHASRFLVWPADEATYPIPPYLACARGGTVAVFDPLPRQPPRIGPVPIDRRTAVVYPKTVLYRLQPNRPDTMTRCPASN